MVKGKWTETQVDDGVHPKTFMKKSKHIYSKSRHNNHCQISLSFQANLSSKKSRVLYPYFCYTVFVIKRKEVRQWQTQN